MKFEYNHDKSKGNLEKHGIDFEDAKKLWQVDNVTVKAQSEDEIKIYDYWKAWGQIV